MQDETARVESVLLEDASIEAILRSFDKARLISFENLLEPLIKVSRSSLHGLLLMTSLSLPFLPVLPVYLRFCGYLHACVLNYGNKLLS